MQLGAEGKVKVLHIVDTLGMGGAETWLMELLRLWRREISTRPQIHFLATSGNRGIFDDEARALGAEIFYLRYRRSQALSFMLELRRILEGGKYSVIHDHQGYASGWHFLMGHGLLPSVRITHIHSALRDFERKRLVSDLGKRLVGRYATVIAGTSRQVITDYGFDISRFAHLPRIVLCCGFDTSRFTGDRSAVRAVLCQELGWPENSKIILCVGRIDPSTDFTDPKNQKNSGFAVSVGIECARRDESVRMALAGEPSSAVPVLQQWIANAGLEGRIRFVGIRRDIERFMLASDLLLFPSRGEGLGMVAVEGQAAGLPVLASDRVPVDCVVVPDLVRFKRLEAGVEAWTGDALELAARPRSVRCANKQVAASAYSIHNSARRLFRIYKRPIGVLHVVDSLGMGGAETWLMELLRLWHRQGSDLPQIDFLVTSGNPGMFDDEAISLGARIFYLRYSRSTPLSFSHGLRRILRRERYAAIHDHQAYVSGWHFAMGAGALPPVRVTHIHNPVYQIQNGTKGRRLSGSLGKHLVGLFATHITGTSRQVITEYGFDVPSFARIPKMALHCGFDPSRFLGDRSAAKASLCDEVGWPKDSKIVLFAGRIDQSPDPGHPKNHKNSGFAISVGIEAARRDPNIRMILAGERSFAVPTLEERIESAGLKGRIRFLGIRKDVERLMLASDVLLFPSRGEGLGMVAVEAQCAGLPVLASTDVPRECVVVPALVQFKDVESGSSAWADDLLQLVGRARDVEGSNKRVASSAFSIENSAQALLRVYGPGFSS
jgi:glycosyltransferase EpsF